jgi:hypothetical protein
MSDPAAYRRHCRQVRSGWRGRPSGRRPHSECSTNLHELDRHLWATNVSCVIPNRVLIFANCDANLVATRLNLLTPEDPEPVDAYCTAVSRVSEVNAVRRFFGGVHHGENRPGRSIGDAGSCKHCTGSDADCGSNSSDLLLPSRSWVSCHQLVSASVTKRTGALICRAGRAQSGQ